eukprot:TRINITY_DN21928_c0_g2_i1.p1 TRINITY_DN21928_c0_g2~~TRINITY_DN21928_c0_g2_i1.p1  ORF type:complete len:589 (-),score=87.86 TRINITY_DN21928_c0_g2_i1:17-1606(-)
MASVLGTAGATLRRMEQDYSVIMFVCDVIGRAKREDTERLCILGSRKGRRAAQLEFMSNVEDNAPDFFLGPLRESGETFMQPSDRYGDWGTSTCELTDDDIRFLIGAGGRTSKALCTASDCIIQIIGTYVFVSGTREQRLRAEDYMGIVLCKINPKDFVAHAVALFDEDRPDRSLMYIPDQDIAYITGKGRETLAEMEDKFGVIMVFAQSINLTCNMPNADRLAIFGPLRGRTCAEIEVLSCVEKNNPGTSTPGLGDTTIADDVFAVDCLVIEDKQNVAYITGQNSTTRSRLSRASGAHLQFVGNILHIAGSLEERTRAKDYVKFHLQLEKRSEQRHIDVSGRSDVTVLETDGRYFNATELFKIEGETNAFCLNAPPLAEGEVRRFLIFGSEGDPDLGGRAKAKKMALAMLKEKGGTTSQKGREARSRTPRQEPSQTWHATGWHHSGQAKDWHSRHSGGDSTEWEHSGKAKDWDWRHSGGDSTGWHYSGQAKDWDWRRSGGDSTGWEHSGKAKDWDWSHSQGDWGRQNW